MEHAILQDYMRPDQKPEGLDIETIVRDYIEARDFLKVYEDAFEQKIKPLKDKQLEREGIIHKFMLDNKLANLRTTAGTAYTKVKYSAALADPSAFMDYVKATGKFELLDRKANVTAVVDFVEEHKTLPPGCNLTGIEKVHVNKPAKRGAKS